MPTDRLDRLIALLSGWAAGVCLIGVLFVTTLQVFCRYVLDAPLIWPGETSRLMFVWLTYGGCLTLPGLRQHLAIEFVYGALSERLRWCADLLADALGLVFFGALALGGFALMEHMAGMLLPALQLPINLMFGYVTVVAVLQSYLHLMSVIGGLMKSRRGGTMLANPGE